MSENYDNPLQKRLQETLQKIVHEDEDKTFNMAGGIVAKWVVGMEVVLPTGEVILYHNCSPNTPGWQVLGVLEYLVAVEKARTMKDHYSEDDE